MLRLVSLCALALAACASPPTVTRWSAAPISSDQFESHPAFDPLSGDLLFVRGRPNFSAWRLMFSGCEGGQRGAVAPAPFAAAGAAEADPFFTPDGHTLYFISTRPWDGAAQPNLDIWRIQHEMHGSERVWGAAEHLSAPVNSPAQEWFPRLTSDGWLYFGSSREGGLGATDIYRARPDDAGGWRVENLGPTINTAGDEYEADFSADGLHMLLMADGDLYRSDFRDGHWTQRVKVDKADVNTDAMEVGALQSRNGRSVLFARDSGDPALSGEIYLSGRSHGFPPPCRR